MSRPPPVRTGRPLSARVRRRRRAARSAAMAGLAVVTVVVVQLGRGAPPPVAHPRPPAALRAPGAARLAWPPGAQAVVAVPAVGLRLATAGQHPVPIASVAKLMTAELVLADHPLAGAAAGPTLTMTAADALVYRQEVAAGDSALPVVAGERLSERQALQALLVVSADNIAERLARWDAGSVAGFVARMNAAARRLGLRQTHYADPSGLEPATVSTAADQLRMAMVAMRQPVLAAIVAEPAASFPVVGRLPNYDALAGRDGVLGIKTGSTTAAGGCWAFAVRRPVAGRPAVVYGVVLGVRGPPNAIIGAALAAGLALADAAPRLVARRTLLPAGSPVGYLSLPWRPHPVPVVTLDRLAAPVVAGARVAFRMVLAVPRVPSRRGSAVGVLWALGPAGPVRTPVVLAAPVAGPGWQWRLGRGP